MLIGGAPNQASQENIQAIQTLLLDRTRCRWQSGSITVVLDGDPAALAAQLSDLAANTVEEFLLYYTGDITLSADGELLLTAPALAWTSVATALRGCTAPVRRVILDCSVTGDLDGPRLADLTAIDGVYTLTAATTDPRLSFSGELVDLVRTGLPEQPPRLTLGALYPPLCRRLLAKDLPVPQQCGSDAEAPFTANGAPGAARAWVEGLLADAERCARSISDAPTRDAALVRVFLLMADTDPEQAQRVAYSFDGTASQVWALSHLAGELAGTDRSRARRLLEDAEHRLDTVTDRRERPRMLSNVVQAVAAMDPRLAERRARTIHDEFWRGLALKRVVSELAPTDPDGAMRVARSITSEQWRASALRDVASEVAASDPDLAQQIAAEISHGYHRTVTLCRIAETVSITDPRRADQILVEAGRVASSIDDEQYRAWALGDVARAVATANPDRAERLAQSISDAQHRVWALVDVALVLYDLEPDRTDRLIDEAERAAHVIVNHGYRLSGLAYLAQRIATTHPDRAARLLADTERLRAETAEPWRTESATDLVRAWAALDPDRAKRLTDTIADQRSRADALCSIAAVELTRYPMTRPSPRQTTTE